MLAPALPDLGDGVIQADGELPAEIERTHLVQINDVAAVIADAVLIHILIHLSLSRMLLIDMGGLQDRTGVGEATIKILLLRHPRRRQERIDEAGHIVGVDIVKPAHLPAEAGEVAAQLRADLVRRPGDQEPWMRQGRLNEIQRANAPSSSELTKQKQPETRTGIRLELAGSCRNLHSCRELSGTAEYRLEQLQQSALALRLAKSA